jgi:hypothetical protein
MCSRKCKAAQVGRVSTASPVWLPQLQGPCTGKLCGAAASRALRCTTAQLTVCAAWLLLAQPGCITAAVHAPVAPRTHPTHKVPPAPPCPLPAASLTTWLSRGS